MSATCCCRTDLYCLSSCLSSFKPSLCSFRTEQSTQCWHVMFSPAGIVHVHIGHVHRNNLCVCTQPHPFQSDLGQRMLVPQPGLLLPLLLLPLCVLQHSQQTSICTLCTHIAALTLSTLAIHYTQYAPKCIHWFCPWCHSAHAHTQSTTSNIHTYEDIHTYIRTYMLVVNNT